MEYGPQSSLDGAVILGQMLLAGAAMGVFYDVFRVLRRFFRFGYSAILAQDILFFCVSAVFVFFTGITLSGGRMRLSYALAALAGWLVYALTAGAAVMFVADRCAALIRAAGGSVRRLFDRLVFGAKKNRID